MTQADWWFEAGQTLADGTHEYRVYRNPAAPTMIADLLTEAEAQQIVRAVNCHEDLLAACERAISALAANGAPNCEAAKECRAAIAKAKT